MPVINLFCMWNLWILLTLLSPSVKGKDESVEQYENPEFTISQQHKFLVKLMRIVQSVTSDQNTNSVRGDPTSKTREIRYNVRFFNTRKTQEKTIYNFKNNHIDSRKTQEEAIQNQTQPFQSECLNSCRKAACLLDTERSSGIIEIFMKTLCFVVFSRYAIDKSYKVHDSSKQSPTTKKSLHPTYPTPKHSEHHNEEEWTEKIRMNITYIIENLNLKNIITVLYNQNCLNDLIPNATAIKPMLENESQRNMLMLQLLTLTRKDWIRPLLNCIRDEEEIMYEMIANTSVTANLLLSSGCSVLNSNADFQVKVAWMRACVHQNVMYLARELAKKDNNMLTVCKEMFSESELRFIDTKLDVEEQAKAGLFCFLSRKNNHWVMPSIEVMTQALGVSTMQSVFQ